MPDSHRTTADPLPSSDAFPFIRAAASRRFVEHWLSLPREGPLPAREAFAPARCTGLLSMILLRDIQPDGHARFRLIGTGICDLFGVELTGQDARAIMPQSNQTRYVAVTQAMFDQPCGICALLHMHTASGRDLLIENISLPFAPREDGRRQTLGHFAIIGSDDRSYGEASTICHADEIGFLDIGSGLPEVSEKLRTLDRV